MENTQSMPEETGGLRVGELHLCHTFQDVMYPLGDLMIFGGLGVGKWMPLDMCDLDTGMLILLSESNITTGHWKLNLPHLPSVPSSFYFLSQCISGPLSPRTAL